MAYSDWTDREWQTLLMLVREVPVQLSDEEIRKAAWSYMQHGADGGGNKLGIVGTHIAMCVDRVNLAMHKAAS